MKVFRYEYYEEWGNGAGIVIAESIEDARKMMREPYPLDKTVEELFPNLEFEEIDITKPQVIDQSWTE
jgi:hypothetical protein